MNDNSCVIFLQWALPKLQMRWSGFRKVRKQVCKRIARRIAELGLADIDAYRVYLETDQSEWEVLGRLCRVTISRFYRDRAVFDSLCREILPGIANQALAQKMSMRIWSGGCSSGEEPYTIALIVHFLLKPRFPGLTFDIIASDIDAVALERARLGNYPTSSLRELPSSWQKEGFEKNGDSYRLKKSIRAYVQFMQRDIRSEPPQGRFDVILCRNLAFTYFDNTLQTTVLHRFFEVLGPNGIIVCGGHEHLPENNLGLVRWQKPLPVYQKVEVNRNPQN